ncbi:26S proteasome non-ATPase regulatory subunit 5 [Rhizoclosmatium sp. JEL0117]|nr:26S proteasome non-ATPase regulatory subunit 5 [Rhizoclosmatium sp. JEL0117]
MTAPTGNHPDHDDDGSAMLETSLSGIWYDLTQLSSAASPAAPGMLKYLQEKQLTITDFIGIIVSGQSDQSVDLACKCIAIVCKVLGLANMDESGLISDGLSHPVTRVQSLVLDLLADPSTPTELRVQYTAQIIPLLSSPSLDVAQSVINLLTLTATTSPETFFSPETVSEFHYFLTPSHSNASSQTAQIRTADLLITIASKSEASFTAVKTSGLLNPIAKEPLESKDVMTRLTGIELLTSLIRATHGLSFLEKSGVLTKMSEFVKATDDDVDTVLTRVAAIGFYAKLVVVLKEAVGVLETGYGFCEAICFALMQSWDGERHVSTQVRDACLVAVGNIGGSRVGLSLLVARYPGCLVGIVETGLRGTGAYKVAAVQSLSCILDNDDWERDDVSGWCERLFFQELGGMDKGILPLIKSFDEEVRIAGYACLKGVAKYSWGLNALRESGQMIAFLLDRATESTQIGRKWRYSVIETILSRGDASKQALQEVIYNRFGKYVKEGPFYAEAQPQVMMASF